MYQGHPGSDITRRLPTNSGDKPRDQSRLRTLVAAASEPDLAVRMASLERILEVDQFISFIAMEVILGHWDGYTLGRNNFRVFHDRETDRLVFLPHGLDQTLQQQTPTIPNPNGSVARALLEIPEARRRYTERVSQLLTNVFKVDAITNHVHEVADRVHACSRRSTLKKPKITATGTTILSASPETRDESRASTYVSQQRFAVR